MDQQLLISWTFFIVVALGFDLASYAFLRRDWQKNGITVVDRFWNWLFGNINQLAGALQKQIAISLLNYHRSTIAAPTSPAERAPLPAVVAPLVELIPVTVQNVGNVRHVQFTLEMSLNTQVEVRIGASRETGVTVEKREL